MDSIEITSSGSLEEFHTRVITDVAPGAIERRIAELIRAADAGLPPVDVLIPDLDHLICEGLYWRSVEGMIATVLAPEFKAIPAASL